MSRRLTCLVSVGLMLCASAGVARAHLVAYWPMEEGAGTTVGDVWVFSTVQALPAQVGNPDPADGATNCPVTLSLNWSAAARADSYDIYLGTVVTLTGAHFQANTANLQFQISNLQFSTAYYWRVKAIDAASNESDWTGACEFYISGPFVFPGWALYTLIAAACGMSTAIPQTGSMASPHSLVPWINLWGSLSKASGVASSVAL